MQGDLVMAAHSARLRQSDAPTPALLGHKLFDRRYSLKRLLAQSAGATVYAAEHAFTRRPVAIKIPRETAPSTALVRMRREIEALTLARGDGVVEMLDAGEVDDKPYIVFELLEGRTVAGLLAARGHLLPEEVVRVGIDAARALERCHEHGVIHRDLKPSNLFATLGNGGAIKLLDFGISNLNPVEPRIGPRLTQENAVLGTPEYMAPESLMTDPNVDERVDIYGLGVTLYECLTGSVPFEGNYGEVLVKVSTGPSPMVRRAKPDAPLGLSSVIERCLARAPGDRFQTMAELARVLESAGGASNIDVHLLERPVGAPERQRACDTLADVPAAKQKQEFEARRKHPRAPYITLARITFSEGFSIDGRIEEVSEGGIQFVGSRAVEPGTVVKIRFALPASGRITEIGATARWSRSVRGNNASGFQFDEIAESARNEIRQYVEIIGRD